MSDAHQNPYFEFVRPRVSTPLLVEVPHAGLAIPDPVRGELSAPRASIARDSDIYVDRLCAQMPARGAHLLSAQISRYVVDLNRAEDDVDGRAVQGHPTPKGAQPRGVIWLFATDGRALMEGPLDFERLERRIALFHRPYHTCIRETLDALKEEHGFAILLAAHSMPSGATRKGPRRADVVPGTRGRTTADPRVIDLVATHFRDAGLSVRHDQPYRGGYSTGHYGRPAHGVHAIQVELNRALYVDERTSRPKEVAFAALRSLLTELASKLSTLDLRT